MLFVCLDEMLQVGVLTRFGVIGFGVTGVRPFGKN